VKRLALFAATVLVPCGLLVVFGCVMIRQDRELAARHAEDQWRAVVQQQQQQRVARLEGMKRGAAEAFFAGRQPPVDFAALVTDGNIHTPWETAKDPMTHLESCEHAEFTGDDAAACYQRASETVHDARRKALIQLLLGRALSRVHQDSRAVLVNRELLATPFSLADEQGVPFAYYAADRLLGIPAETPVVRSRFRQEEPSPAAPSAAYLLKSIGNRLGDAALQHRAAAAIEFANQVESLEADLPALLPALRRDDPEPVWIEHGPWQISLAKTPESGKELLVGIASSRLPARVAAPVTTAPSPRKGLYLAALALVFLIAASGAYLLWRDVQRDVQLAEMRSQFVSSVSHELKTPLTAIRMFAETLRIRPASQVVSREEYLDTILNESERLSRLVDNVLDFSKIEQGRKLYRLQPISIDAVMDTVLRAAHYPLQQAGVTLKVAAGEELPLVNADADALQQAVLNLVMNAMKYSGERKEIEIETRREDGVVVIGVRDYGIGIPVEYQGRIFERFYRVPSAENQGVPGAGLGLTLVAHIAKAHGGEVTVESTPGTGSLFALRLPVEQQV
jgi:signal transduction histidine kinase